MGNRSSNSNGLVIISAGLTDVGQRRERNEDSLLWDENTQLYVVADGMGGHVGGGLASQMAVNTIVRVVAESHEDLDATITEQDADLANEGQSAQAIMQRAVQQASQEIFARSVEEPSLRGMGTTVVALWFQGSKAFIANVGDSRGYLLRDGKLKQLTVDHSLVGEQMRAGMLSQDDARVHRLKNIITRSVGFQEAVDIDIESWNVKPGDLFLLCSDGLTNMVSDPELQTVLREKQSLEEACHELVDLANARGGEDNITLVLARVESCGAGAADDDTDDWEEQTMQL